MESVEVLQKQLAMHKENVCNKNNFSQNLMQDFLSYFKANRKSEIQAKVDTRLADLLLGVERIFK